MEEVSGRETVAVGYRADKEVLDETRCVLRHAREPRRQRGGVLNRLKELKIDRDTIVVYFSDNGPQSWRWNDGMKGKKGSVDEGGIRVPLFVLWPNKIVGGRVVPQIAVPSIFCRHFFHWPCPASRRSAARRRRPFAFTFRQS